MKEGDRERRGTGLVLTQSEHSVPVSATSEWESLKNPCMSHTHGATFATTSQEISLLDGHSGSLAGDLPLPGLFYIEQQASCFRLLAASSESSEEIIFTLKEKNSD